MPGFGTEQMEQFLKENNIAYQTIFPSYPGEVVSQDGVGRGAPGLVQESIEGLLFVGETGGVEKVSGSVSIGCGERQRVPDA